MTVELPLLLAGEDRRPDGPSWSPYLAVAIWLCIAIILGVQFYRRRRQRE